ncbi:biofilm regulation protein phosphatase SiaA [Tepidiphilus olei]|uniref:biofilm regulation protein phosphatase SiaA n=1 Tax=Tepidiphilus olei TaxID=2502184 RepID=UPI00115D7FBF|nr:biofilm regulation protein phosphatase SiaA [Tepidiphilus olei]
MAKWGFGIRAKSTLALLLVCLVVLVPVAAIGMQLFQGLREHFAETWARNFTELHGERIAGPLSREVALARRLAGSMSIRNWLRREDDEALRQQARLEAEGYRRDFLGRAWFLASRGSLAYYFDDDATSESLVPRYRLDPEKPEDAWFFATLAAPTQVNINPNPDRWLQQVMVWINVVVEDQGERLGVAGTGVDLTTFISSFLHTTEAGVTPIIIDRKGAIQAHPDPQRIAWSSGATGTVSPAHTFSEQLTGTEDAAHLAAAMQRTAATPGTVEVMPALLDGRRQMLAITWLEPLQWYLITAVDLETVHLFEDTWVRIAVGIVVLVLLSVLTLFTLSVDRLLLQPLRGLHRSAMALASGRFDVPPADAGRDELGDLNRAFAHMARQIANQTQELEDEVRARTAELRDANAAMAASQKKLGDSIQYASLIQRALLPDRALATLLGEHHFVLWRPRDMVGGDFYLFRAEPQHYLIGIVDCAGHGVPGSLMTMLARTAFDDAMNRHGIEHPAVLLEQADATLRGMLDQAHLPRAIAASTDAALVYVDRNARRLRYAGARIDLYWSDGDTVHELSAERRSLCDRKKGEYTEIEIPLREGVTYTLVTDGYLDQAGGEHGFGFGDTRFREVLRHVARLPFDHQAQAVDAALESWRSGLPQRDDITLLSFRID